MMKWYTPLDPECPEVKEFMTALWEDPMTKYYGVGDEVAADWERKHIRKCERCLEYGLANIAIV